MYLWHKSLTFISYTSRYLLFSDSESRKNNGAARQNFGAKTEKEGEKEATNFRGKESPGGGRYEDDRLIH